MEYTLTRGDGIFQVNLVATPMGTDLLVRIFNTYAHIGAVAIGEYDFKNERASVSVVTRLGHKEDAIAQQAAYLISKTTKKAVCVVAGVHLDNIGKTEILQLMENALGTVDDLLKQL
jgi:hypothetical protein